MLCLTELTLFFRFITTLSKKIFYPMKKKLAVFVALAMIMIPSAIGAKVKYDYGVAPHADGGWGGG